MLKKTKHNKCLALQKKFAKIKLSFFNNTKYKIVFETSVMLVKNKTLRP